MNVVTMMLTIKKSLMKISHGFMADMANCIVKKRPWLAFKSVDARSLTSGDFLPE